MALECLEIDSCIQEISPPRSNFFSKNPLKKQSLAKPVPKYTTPARRAAAETVAVVSSDDSSVANPHRRLITDLPPALVSEILHCLDAKDLGVVSCVSTLLHALATNHFGWKDFYFERWGPPSGPQLTDSDPSSSFWKELFVERETKSRCFMGRYSVDSLHGNTEAVRAVFLLQSAGLVFTGGYDSVIRMWDVDDGFLISASRPLGCTVRAIAADAGLLVVAGTGAFIHCWRATPGHPRRFDITGFVGGAGSSNSELRLWGHEGPITCLGLDSARIFSGSWDMSVRVWDRASLKCLTTLRHIDWVWALVPRGSTVASTAGRDAYIWDVESGTLVNVVHDAHVSNSSALARSYSGDLLFTGGEDGAIHMFEVGSQRSEEGIRKIATWKPHTGPISSLAFEFPWLVSSSSDGRLSLIDVRKLLRSEHRSKVNKPAANGVEPPQRMLHWPGSNLFSVAIGADRIVCGGEDSVVRIWNFSQALDIEKRIRASRGIRLENRMRRRKVQIEMNSKSGRPDQSIVLPKKNQMSGSRNGISNGKQHDRRP